MSLPIPLRLLLTARPELVTPVLQAVQLVLAWQLLNCAQVKADEGQGGAVTLIQRFGSAANLNIHLHCLALDGDYRRRADGVPIVGEVSPRTDGELHGLLQTVTTRLLRRLTRREALIGEEEMSKTYLAELNADGDEARTLRARQAAAITYRLAFGPRAWQKLLTPRGAMPLEGTARQPLLCRHCRFSLHAAVRGEAPDRKRLEQLCRYVTRPTLSDGRGYNSTSPVCSKLISRPRRARALPAWS